MSAEGTREEKLSRAKLKLLKYQEQKAKLNTLIPQISQVPLKEIDSLSHTINDTIDSVSGSIEVSPTLNENNSFDSLKEDNQVNNNQNYVSRAVYEELEQQCQYYSDTCQQAVLDKQELQSQLDSMIASREQATRDQEILQVTHSDDPSVQQWINYYDQKCSEVEASIHASVQEKLKYETLNARATIDDTNIIEILHLLQGIKSDQIVTGEKVDQIQATSSLIFDSIGLASSDISKSRREFGGLSGQSKGYLQGGDGIRDLIRSRIDATPQ